jgi:hypothetical protein
MEKDDVLLLWRCQTLRQKIHNHRRDAEQEVLTRPSNGVLPKPIRLFSYLFFGTVFLIGVCDWFISRHP